MLYHRDEQSGEHIVTSEGSERRYATRAAALAAARALLIDQSNEHTGDASPSDDDPED